jgi:hypothetical protein
MKFALLLTGLMKSPFNVVWKTGYAGYLFILVSLSYYDKLSAAAKQVPRFGNQLFP